MQGPYASYVFAIGVRSRHTPCISSSSSCSTAPICVLVSFLLCCLLVPLAQRTECHPGLVLAHLPLAGQGKAASAAMAAREAPPPVALGGGSIWRIPIVLSRRTVIISSHLWARPVLHLTCMFSNVHKCVGCIYQEETRAGEDFTLSSLAEVLGTILALSEVGWNLPKSKRGQREPLGKEGAATPGGIWGGFWL